MFSSEKWLAKTGGSGFYNGVVTQSLRFDDARECKLTRTPSSSGNQKKWTTSFWVKRSKPGQLQYLWSGGSYSGNDGIAAIYFHSTDTIHTYFDTSGSNPYGEVNSRVYRDPSQWYHIVWAVDAANTVQKIWINGVEETLNSGNNPPNFDYGMNRAGTLQAFGVAAWGGSADLDGYLAHFVHLDGQYLTHDSFGETKEGVWIPKDTSGLTFGTNGFQLEFKQTGTGTASASTIGADTSGNDNHLTSSGLVASDSNMPDCPENNFATLNPLQKGYASTPLTEGNLKLTGTGSAGAGTYSFKSASMGMTFPTYWEVLVNAITATGRNGSGILAEDFDFDGYGGFSTDLTGGQSGKGHGSTDFYNETSDVNDVTAESAGDIAMYAFDPSSGKLWHGVNGTWSNSGNPASDSNPTSTVSALLTWFPSANIQSSSDIVTFNFGQDSSFAGAKTAQGNSDGGGSTTDFYYTPPTNFLALCTANLSEPTISPNANSQANDHFDAQIWSGDNTDTRNITDYEFQPDFAWIKNRTTAVSHVLFDSSRGVSGSINTALVSDNTDSEGLGDNVTTSAQFGGVSAFLSNGFTLTEGNTDDARYTNKTSSNYVGFAWKANGGTTTTNDASSTGVGDIDSVYQVNTDAGFSIVTYTGDGQDNTTREIAHGLGVKPRVVMVKNRSSNVNWRVYHEDLSDHGTYVTNGIILNSSNAESGFSSQIRAVSSTTFTVRDPDANGNAFVNKNNDNYVAYCFAEIEGYSKHGVYKGNGSTDGSFIYTGFTPRWIMTKRKDASDNWAIYDSERDTINVRDSYLYADSSQAEATYSTAIVDFLSNGFKWRGAVNFGNNSSGTYIYMAFASLPFKYSNAM